MSLFAPPRAGREMAIQLASQGSGIAISDVNEEGLKEVCAGMHKHVFVRVH